MVIMPHNTSGHYASEDGNIRSVLFYPQNVTCLFMFRFLLNLYYIYEVNSEPGQGFYYHSTDRYRLCHKVFKNANFNLKASSDKLLCYKRFICRAETCCPRQTFYLFIKTLSRAPFSLSLKPYKETKHPRQLMSLLRQP